MHFNSDAPEPNFTKRGCEGSLVLVVLLGVVLRYFHFGGDSLLSFRGHSRPARSCRYKIDCSAETV